MSEKMQKRRDFLVNAAYLVVIPAIVYFIFKYFINMIMPFFLAFFFVALSRPMAKWMCKRTKTVKNPDGTKSEVPRRFHLNDKLAAILSVVVIFIIIAGILALIIFRIIDTGSEIVSAAPVIYYDTIQPDMERVFADLTQWASRFDESVFEVVQSSAPQIISSIGGKVTEWSGSLLIWISSLATNIPTLLLNTIICLIATVFIAVDYKDISTFLSFNLPEKIYSLAVTIKDSFVDIVWKFVRSYFIIFVITAAEISLGLLLVGQKWAILIGVLVAIFDAFPIVGSGMIMLPWAIITLISGKIGKGIGLFFVYLIVVVVRQIIEPKIVGKRVGMRPIVTLLCMFVGTSLFGGLGLLGVPIMMAIIVDLNSSGIIKLFKNVPEPGTPEQASKTEQ